MEYDLVIRNVKVIIDDEPIDACIGIEEEKIIEISKVEPKYVSSIDGKGGLLIPGAIDPHAHMWDPEYHYREDFSSGSSSAILGGITTVIDMPLVHDVDSQEKVRERCLLYTSPSPRD